MLLRGHVKEGFKNCDANVKDEEKINLFFLKINCRRGERKVLLVRYYLCITLNKVNQKIP